MSSLEPTPSTVEKFNYIWKNWLSILRKFVHDHIIKTNLNAHGNTADATINTQHILPNADDTYDIGEDGKGWRKVFISRPANGQTPRAGVRGFHSYHANGDIFVGQDNVFPGFYSQKTVITNSAKTNYDDDYSNLFQGNSTFEAIEVNYNVGDGTTESGLAGTGFVPTDPRKGAIGIGHYDPTLAKGGGGLVIWGRGNQRYVYLVHNETDNRFEIQGSNPNKTINDVASIGIGGGAVADFVPLNDDQVDLGTSSLRWKDLILSGVLDLGGGQVKFPATQAGSSDANTLDDYKEGDWTPGISFGGGTTGITYTTQEGSYTKIGRLVTINGGFLLSSKGSSTGTALITGLPFTIKNSLKNVQAVSLRLSNVSYANSPQGYGGLNTTTITLEEITEAGVASTMDETNFVNTSSIWFALSYMV